jgi:Zinc knuckle
MSELIAMCVEEEEEKIKVEKLDFAHVVADGPKLKKIKDNGKDKNKVDMIFGVNKASTSGTKHTSKCHYCKKRGHMRKDCKKFKDWLAKKGK